MADDDQDFEMWDAEFLEKAIQAADAASSSSSNTTQPPPKRFPPAPLPLYAPHISYSPPRELSQRVKEENNRNLPDKGFDCPVSLNGINQGLSTAHPFPPFPPRELSQRVKEVNHRNISDKGFDCPVSLNSINRGLGSAHPFPLKEVNHRNIPDKGFDCPVSLNSTNRVLSNAPPFPHSSRLHDEDKHSKQQEINRLKEELGKVSKALSNLEQECSELKKDREKNEKLLKAVVPVNGFKDAEASCISTVFLKNKNPLEDDSIIHPGTKVAVPCKAVGVQTDEHTVSDELTIKKNLSVTYHHSRKLADIWEPGNDQKPRNNLVSKLFVACESDLQIIFGCLGLNIQPKKTDHLFMAPNDSIQSVEAAKVSHLYLTLTKISYDTGRLDDLFEALVDLCHVENKMIVHRCLCVLHVVLKHILSIENKGCNRDNVIVNDSEKHPVVTRLINAKKVDDSSSSSLKWFSLFQTMHQLITRHSEENIRVEAVSIMNMLLLRTDAYTERQMYGEVAVFETISQLLKKEAGVGVQKQTVDLLYLLLNCPNLMVMLCSSCKEEGTSNTESTKAILDGLADCLACREPTTLVLKLQRNAIIVVAFIASSGRRGFEILMGRTCSRRRNFLFLILQNLASQVDDVEASQHFRERRLVIREALIVLNRLASSCEYSPTVLRLLTSRRDMACLTIDIATRLSRNKDNTNTIIIMRDNTEIVDLARIFKKRLFSFLGDTK